MFLSSACYEHDREVYSKVTEPHKGKRDPRRLSEEHIAPSKRTNVDCTLIASLSLNPEDTWGPCYAMP